MVVMILDLFNPIVWLVKHVCSDKPEFPFLQKKTAFVKSETTSKDTNSSQALRVLSLMKSANSPEFLIVLSVFPTTGDKVLAREPEIA